MHSGLSLVIIFVQSAKCFGFCSENNLGKTGWTRVLGISMIYLQLSHHITLNFVQPVLPI